MARRYKARTPRKERDDYEAVQKRSATGYVVQRHSGAWWVISTFPKRREFVVAEHQSKRDAVAHLRIWRLMNGLTERGLKT